MGPGNEGSGLSRSLKGADQSDRIVNGVINESSQERIRESEHFATFGDVIEKSAKPKVPPIDANAELLQVYKVQSDSDKASQDSRT